MKKILTIIFFLAFVPFYVFSFNSIQISAIVGSVLTLSMEDTQEFFVVDSSGDLIQSKELGTFSVQSSFNSWKLLVNSDYAISLDTGRLKLDSSEVYIPYTFEVRDGSSLILSEFNRNSSPQTATPFSGKNYKIFLFFVDDDTNWPQGIYRDTLVLSVTSD